MNELDFSTLLASAQRGAPEAQAELHRRFIPLVVHRLRRQAGTGLRPSHDTADLAQSVFVEVIRDLPRLEDRGEPAFRRWLTIKAVNKVRAKYRRSLDSLGRRREVSLDGIGIGQRAARRGPATSATLREDQENLRHALRSLRPKEQLVLIAREQGTRSYADVAAILDLPTADAARKQHARALLALSRALRTATGTGRRE